MAWKFDDALRTARANAITTFAGTTVYIRIYNGSQPAKGGTATTLLAELRGNATFAPGATTGVLTLNAITADSSADATGTATWVRLTKTDGTTFIMDGTVGTSGSDLNLSTVSIVAAGNVSITSASFTEGNN